MSEDEKRKRMYRKLIKNKKKLDDTIENTFKFFDKDNNN